MTGAQDPRPPWAGTPIPAWYQRGSCRGVDIRLFFEERYEELGRRVCSSCPVREPCLRWALEVGGPSLVGIWGSSSQEDRKRIRRAQRRDGAT